MLKALSISGGFREFGPEILENSDERKETHENSRDGELLRARSDLVLGGGSTDSINCLLWLHPVGEDRENETGTIETPFWNRPPVAFIETYRNPTEQLKSETNTQRSKARLYPTRTGCS